MVVGNKKVHNVSLSRLHSALGSMAEEPSSGNVAIDEVKVQLGRLLTSCSERLFCQKKMLRLAHRTARKMFGEFNKLE